ncbi:Aspartate aminotransferase, cytoplasmic [Strongyloides ratti]|uniref:Aspartate aminotransferase n=1 Tax=Strongyloides ratti TaxID=34506 RepID=A0A090LMA9_STRRB|nr:Aspartate aminotransferase, cytoplasmic [Strongyloides ratti]CEF69308.1 Aspartate aminotransferase, cytoplasmic [Strongyloides ratti]
MSLFNDVSVAPPIEVFFMNKKCQDDTDPNKVNLTIGAYRTEEGKPLVLPVVREAEKRITADESLNHEYLPVLGHEGFSNAAAELVLGSDSIAIKEGRYFGVQCLSGTGSLRIGAETLHDLIGLDTVYVSNPTWGNHNAVFKKANFKNIHKYHYWDSENRKVDIDNMLKDLENAPKNSVIVLHGCAHNPTGMDPTHDQWVKIAEVVKRKNLFPFFDIAYQGFASGDPDADAWAIRYFVDQGLEMVISQSFAKNFGLYNERIGNLTVVVTDPKVITGMKSQISLIIRANWSNPPAHGARIVHMVLTNPDLKSKWFESIKEMSGRIKEMRSALRTHLEALETPGKWDHITQQIGMFSYTGLNSAQVKHLVEKHHVFLLSDGRINICGLNTKNVEYVAKAINETVRNISNKL